MQSRIIFNLVNGKSIADDWRNVPREVNEQILIDDFIPNLISGIYFHIRYEGHMRIINAKQVTDLFVEEQDEPEF